MGLCAIRNRSLAVRPYLAQCVVVGEFQRLGTSWPTGDANSADDLLGGTACIRPDLYLQCRKDFVKAILTILFDVENLF